MAQVPEISDDLKGSLRADRLFQHKARIYNMQMDIVAYQAVGDETRLAQAEKNLDELVASYYAIEAMV